MRYTLILGAAALLAGVAAMANAEVADAGPQRLGLEQAIEMALLNSPRLKAAEAMLSATQGAERQAAAWSNPEVGVDVENLAGSGPYTGTQAAEFTYNLSQKVELGKRPARRQVAGAERETAGVSVLAEKLDIVRDVRAAYAGVLAAERAVQVAGQQEKLAADVLANVARRVGAARDPLIYKSQAEVALATARMAQAQAVRDAQLARKKLAALWGGEPVTQPLDETVLDRTEQPAPLETYRARLADNPDLARYTPMKLAKEAAIRLEKAQNIPDPSVNVGLRAFRESGEQAMLVGVSMPIPVFDRNRGNIAKARAELGQVEQEGRTATLDAEQALLEAWQEWDLAHTEAVQLRDDIIPNAEKAFGLSRQGYERGRFSYLEILNAQRTLYEALGRYNQSLLRQATAKAQVQRLTAEPIAPPTTPTPEGETR